MGERIADITTVIQFWVLIAMFIDFVLTVFIYFVECPICQKPVDERVVTYER
jgi:hypothetical protein